MARQKRPEFDPSGPFVARRDFPFRGKLIKRGTAFDKASSTRQFRQLYTHRYIDLGGPVIEDPAFDEATILATATAATGIRFRSIARAKKALAELN